MEGIIIKSNLLVIRSIVMYWSVLLIIGPLSSNWLQVLSGGEKDRNTHYQKKEKEKKK